MAEIHNELKWSFSRMKTFDSCRRQYYLRHYLFWDGWKKDAPEDRRTAYRLSKMTSLAMFAGNVVHSRVADAFKRYRFNRTRTTLNELIETARLDWERGIAESESGKWRTHPKQYCCIFEHYSGLPDWKERAREMWERIETSLRCFDSSGTWADLRKTPPRKWLAYDGDPFEAVLVDGIPMFGRPDLAYDASKPENPNSRCWIFEFKTGRPRDGDVLQVRYYALVAAADWGFDPLSVKARLVYLHPQLIEREMTVDEDALADAGRVLHQSFEDMKSVLADPERNIPLDISAFPPAVRGDLCARCFYQEMCEGRGTEASRPTAAALDEDDFDPFV